MANKCIFFLLVMLSPIVAFSQGNDSSSHQETTTPPIARYQIVQSTITMRDTYRLDRYAGRVHRLVKSSDGDLLWEEMIVKNRPQVTNPSTPRFQIFLSGIAAKGSYLIDTFTGQTWQIVGGLIDPKGKDIEDNKYTYWTPLKVENLN